MAITLFAGAAALLAAAGTAFALRRGEGGRIGSPAAALLAFMSIVFGLWADKTNLLRRVVSLRRMASQAPVQTLPDEEKFISNWNVRGATQDSMRYRFADDWEFPYGDGHLKSVELLSYGEIWPKWNDTNAVARLGAPVEIRRGLSSFAVVRTDDNAYVFSWGDAIVQGDVDNPVSAAIRLDRNGDVTVTTNGISTFRPRVLPFAHDGFGQDEEWVRANFTNADEILYSGYPQWVDAQVGHDRTNGLYKLSVNVAEDPPETVRIGVGDMSIAVANAGEYVFLLKKGTRYALTASSDCAEDFVYSAVDDSAGPLPRQARRQTARNRDTNGVWTSDMGALVITAPAGDLIWLPRLDVLPNSWHPDSASPTGDFYAFLSDVPDGIEASYGWRSFGAMVDIAQPGESATSIACRFPYEKGSAISLALDVSAGGETLHSDYSYAVAGNHEDDCEYEHDFSGSDETPGMSLSAVPDFVVVNGPDPSYGRTSEISCSYLVDKPGAFELKCDDPQCVVRGDMNWTTEGNAIGRKYFTVESAGHSPPGGSVFSVEFTPEDDSPAMMASATIYFVEVETEAIVGWPGPPGRTRIGVFENVYVNVRPGQGEISLNSAGAIRGMGSSRYVYTAPGVATNDVVRTSSGVPLCRFAVVEPSGYEAAVTQRLAFAVSPGEAGAFLLRYKLDLLPKTVSFENIELQEQCETASVATGYFSLEAQSDLLAHGQAQGAGSWAGVGNNNSAGGDTVGIRALQPPWGEGGVLFWTVPVNLKRKGTDGPIRHCFDTNMKFTLHSDGAVWIEKFDLHDCCTTDRQFFVGSEEGN